MSRVDDIRWFSPNRHGTLPVPILRHHGLRIALEGGAPARLAVAADGVNAIQAFEYARRHHARVMVYLWDLPPWRFAGGKPDFVFELGGRVRRLPRTFNRYPGRPGYYSRLRYVARRSREVWCPCHETVAEVAARFGVEPLRVPFCYDSDLYVPGESPAPGNGTRLDLLSISRLVPYKNHAIILRAAARLNPIPGVRIIGRGPEAPELRRLAADLGVPLDLIDTWVSEGDMVSAYRSARLVICPSTFEGFGLTPMEAIGVGKPVIASDIPPHREFLRHQVRFFKPDDVRGLAESMEAVLGAGGATAYPSPTPLHDVTIEACAARFLPGLQRLLA